MFVLSIFAHSSHSISSITNFRNNDKQKLLLLFCIDIRHQIQYNRTLLCVVEANGIIDQKKTSSSILIMRILEFNVLFFSSRSLSAIFIDFPWFFFAFLFFVYLSECWFFYFVCSWKLLRCAIIFSKQHFCYLHLEKKTTKPTIWKMYTWKTIFAAHFSLKPSTFFLFRFSFF